LRRPAGRTPMPMATWSAPQRPSHGQSKWLVMNAYRTVHLQRDNLHAGMLKKPLEPYHPNAFRSRLPQPTVVMPYKNSSQIVIGDRSTEDRRLFKTTNQLLQMKADPNNCVTNGGILAAATKWTHHNQFKAWKWRELKVNVFSLQRVVHNQTVETWPNCLYNRSINNFL
jgi:hypothetical protein